MAWKITTKTFTAGESPYIHSTAGDHTDIIVQAGSGLTTIRGSIDGTNLAADVDPNANTPAKTDNYPYFVFTNASGDTVLIAERVQDPS